MESNVLSRVFAVCPSEDDWDFSSIPELRVLAGNGHPSKSGPTEIEMRMTRSAAGTLIGDDDGDGSPRADGLVQALDLVAGSTSLPSFEQHWVHRPHPCPPRPHVHHRPIPTCPTVAPVAVRAAVPGGGGGKPMWVGDGVRYRGGEEGEEKEE